MGAAVSRRKLLVRFLLLAGIASVFVFTAYFLYAANSSFAERERLALSEARALCSEIEATWNYIESIQEQINYSNGEYDFKGVYCVAAGKRVAARLYHETGYTVRYVRENPRNSEDGPDEFESAALRSFRNGEAEVYEIVNGPEAEDGPLFRYVVPLEATSHCLECHGDPAGEKDIVGFPKEGMRQGDLAGAISITLPLNEFEVDSANRLRSAVAFFCLLLVLLGTVLSFGIRRWVAAPILEENSKLHDEAKSQSEFLAVTTHDLKAPLSSIMAYQNLLLQEAHTESERSKLREIAENGTRLLTTIDNILDAARMEEGALNVNLDDIDIGDIAARIRSIMDPVAAKNGIDLDIACVGLSRVVRTDCEMVCRIVTNLVANAIRFTKPGGTVNVRFEYREKNLVISVADNGTGIRKELVDDAFERFSSAAGSGRTGKGGTGLGLYIVRSFAEALGGSVQADSIEGQGSTFTVAIPAADAQEMEGDETIE